jgi:hypothetical protein
MQSIFNLTNVVKIWVIFGDNYYSISIWKLGIYNIIQWNLSNPTHQRTMKMCRIVQDVRIMSFIQNQKNSDQQEQIKQ